MTARYALVWVGWFVTMSSSAVPAQEELESSPRQIQVGHWLELRGRFEAGDRFVASRAKLRNPQRYELIVGTVATETRDGRFDLLGQSIEVSKKTDWQGIAEGDLAGKRVKVEGHYRNVRKFSAREIAPRGAGRERLGGRVDELAHTNQGVEVHIMRYTVLLPYDLSIDRDRRVRDIPLAPSRGVAGAAEEGRDEEDLFGDGIALTDSLRLVSQLDVRSAREENFDLDLAEARDREDYASSLRIRWEWSPSESLGVAAEMRSRLQYRDDENDGISRDDATRIGETFFYLRNLSGLGLDLQAGRQDFDERREWLYDQNLDAVRLIGSWSPVRLELSLSTNFSDARARDLAATNYIAYLSNQNRRRHLAIYAIYRDILGEIRETPLHAGFRMHGHWIPDHKSWLELAYLSGEKAGAKLSAQGVDVGTTWSPDFGEPFSFTLGYAYGSGDADPADGVSRTFRQTGMQDNNDKFGGVTSFRYYGELTDPELSNLHILTAGWGMRLAEKTSLDLVWHRYRQDYPARRLTDTDLDRRPDGVHRDLGWEIDAIFGLRRSKFWNVEVVGAYFRPGDAYTNDDAAYLLKFQVRFRL